MYKIVQCILFVRNCVFSTETVVEKEINKFLAAKFECDGVKNNCAASSVADPDPKYPHNFAGSGSIIFSMDPD